MGIETPGVTGEQAGADPAVRMEGSPGQVGAPRRLG
jgi:hypothetical protein